MKQWVRRGREGNKERTSHETLGAGEEREHEVAVERRVVEDWIRA